MRLVERLARDLVATAAVPLPHRGDQDEAAGDTAAAVLVAVTDRPAPGVLLTQRPESMRRHPGQVAFPGGRVDAGDADAVAAALREAEEEIALPPALAHVAGVLPPYHTVTGFAVVPVVAAVPPDLPLVAHAREVAALFEAPLGWALDPASWTRRTVLYEGRERGYWEAWWEGRRIWGATAAMLVNLRARLPSFAPR